MTTPDQRAEGKDRSAAIKLVEDALKAGRIVQADRDMRVDQLRQAQSVQDIDLQVRDLRVWAAAPTAATTPSAAPSATPVPVAAAGEQPWPLVNYGPQSHETADVATAIAKSGGRAIGGVIAAVVLVSIVVPIAAAVIAFVSSRDSFDFGALQPSDDTTYLPGQEPGENGVNVHTVDGFGDLVGALRDGTGGAFAYSAVLYPRYAVLDVPLGNKARYQSYYWDGRDLGGQDIKGTSTDDQFDLSLVDPNQLIAMLDLVRGRVENPDTWYVIVRDSSSTETLISAYASNDFGETSYIQETLDGTVVYDSDAQP